MRHCKNMIFDLDNIREDIKSGKDIDCEEYDCESYITGKIESYIDIIEIIEYYQIDGK